MPKSGKPQGNLETCSATTEEPDCGEAERSFTGDTDGEMGEETLLLVAWQLARGGLVGYWALGRPGGGWIATPSQSDARLESHGISLSGPAS